MMSDKTIEDAIKELIAQRETHHREIQRIDTAIRELQLSLCKVKVGDIVRYKRDKREYRVVEIDAPQYGWVFANPKNGDGRWGKAKRRLFDDYEIIAPASAEGAKVP